MKVKTRVTFKAYVRLLFKLAYEKPILRLLLGVALIILLWILFYYLDLFNLPEPVIYQYITLGLIGIVQPTVLFLSIRRNYYSSNHLQESLEMEMTQTEMKIKGISFYLEIKWDKLFKIVETPNFFLIYQNNLSAIIIPKKDLLPSDMNNIREIIKGIKNVPVKLIHF